MTSENFTVEVNSETLQMLDALAISMEMPLKDLVNQALNDFLDAHVWQTQKFAQGIASAKHGLMLSEQDMVHELEELLDLKEHLQR